MKNQYFGDLYDYIKYGLLRQLSNGGQFSTAVCWMLTQNDNKGDGQRVNYLHQPVEWRIFDPLVFDCLRTALLERNERDISVMENSGLLASTKFYSQILTDGAGERRKYFHDFLEFSRGSELIFFDPDNGFEIKSVKYGRKGASRYLFFHEASQAFSQGHSLLVYQHMPPKPRDPFISELANSLIDQTRSETVYVFRTQRVAFFLVPQATQLGQFMHIASRVQANWRGLLNTRRYQAKHGTLTNRNVTEVVA